jgi:hypothetical protein
VALVEGNAEVELFRAHPTNNKILSNHPKIDPGNPHPRIFFYRYVSGEGAFKKWWWGEWKIKKIT